MNPHLTLSVAAPAGKENTAVHNVLEMDQKHSFLNIMCFEFVGSSWSDRIGYHSNLHGLNEANDLNVGLVLHKYTQMGASLSQLVM